MRRFLKFIRGSVDLELSSADPERFINLCIGKGMRLSRVRRAGADLLFFSMATEDFKALPGLVRRKGFRVRIKEKHVPALLFKKAAARPFFFIGLVLAVAFIAFTSGFVWNINLEPNGGDDRLLLATLEEFGLKTGAKKAVVDEDILQQQMLLAHGELSWIGIILDGSTAKVSYKLRVAAPEIVPRDVPCSIYAAKTGILTKLDVFQGHKAARVGQTVMAGELLVSATVPGVNAPDRQVHSIAAVEARTWYELKAHSPAIIEKKIYTGAKIKRTCIIAGGRRFNLGSGYGKVFEHYDIITEAKRISANLPVVVMTETLLEFRTESCALPASSEEARLKARLTEILRAGLGGGQISASVFSGIEDSGTGALSISMSAECSEDIGVVRELKQE